MDNTEMINVVVAGEKIQTPLKFIQVSQYMRSLQALGFDEEQQIEVDSVSKQTFEQILKFYEITNYEEVFIKTPIKSSNIRDILTKNISDYIQKYPIESAEFKSLIKACEFLGCRNLMRVCAARCACFLYFEDSKDAFEEKQKELKVKVNVEFEDNQKFKKLYPFMNS